MKTIVLIIVVLSWFGCAAFGMWLYRESDTENRWYHWLLALCLGWLWLLPIGMYPFLKDDEMI